MIESPFLTHLDNKALIDFLQRLVQTPSVYLPHVAGANETAAALLVADLLRGWGWQVLVEEVAPGRPNVIAELPGSLGPGPLLLMEGHTDVVTPGDLAAWSCDPFGGEIRAGRLYGRGAVDMKGGLAAMLFAGRALQLAGAPFRGTLRLLVPVDEEGMMLGIKHMVAQGHAHGAIGCIVCEPEGGEICVAQKGSLRLQLRSYGRIAHGAMPHTGINALSGLVRWLDGVLALERELNTTHGIHPLLGPLYISPTVAAAGDPAQINVLPGYAEALLDIRSIPAVTHKELIARINACAAQVRAIHPDYRFDLAVIDDRPATEIAPAHALVQAIAVAHQEVYGNTAPLGGVPGSTDGTILVRDAGVPVVVYGPGDKWLPHQPDEFVAIDEVIRAAQVYILAVERILK